MALRILLIFVGSGVGGVLRYAVSAATQHLWPASLPLGTIIVNITGSFAIGFLALTLGAPNVREEYRLAILVGVLGGYTTFSAFSRESLALLHDGRWTLALLNIAVTNVLGLAAAFAGWAIAMKTHGPQLP